VEYLEDVGAVLFISKHSHRSPEPGFTVLGEPAVVFVFIGKEGVDYLHVVRGTIFGQRQFGGHRRSSTAAELANDSVTHGLGPL
jgi:hypothetical protein